MDTIRTDIPTSSTVTDVIVWNIEQSGTDTFSATYEVDQQIKEGEQTTAGKATYTVKVHVDSDGDMVIIQHPTLAPAIQNQTMNQRQQKQTQAWTLISQQYLVFLGITKQLFRIIFVVWEY